MRVETLTDPEALRGLEEEQWRQLAASRSNAFVSPEWLFAWWRHFGEGQDPFIVLCRSQDGSLLGMLPLTVARQGAVRVCRVAGANLGDVLHPVAPAGEDDAVAAAAGAALESGPRWTLLMLDNALGVGWPARLAEAAPRRLRTRERLRSSLASIELAEHGDWDSYLASRSRKLRTQIRRDARRLEREGATLRRTERPEELEEDMESFFRLHELRMQSRGGSSLGSGRARSFHLEFASAALRAGWLRLWLMEVGGEPFACWYGWRIGRSYSYYNGGFDPAWKRFGPGAAILAAVIREAFAEDPGARFDFLLGEEPHKLRFAEPAAEVHSLVLSRSGTAGSALAGLDVGARRIAGSLPDSIGRDSRLARVLGRALPGARRT